MLRRYSTRWLRYGGVLRGVLRLRPTVAYAHAGVDCGEHGRAEGIEEAEGVGLAVRIEGSVGGP